MRSDYDLPNAGNAAVPFSFKPSFNFPGRPHSSLTLAEQAELEYELRYRGNMIVDQQRKIQQLEDELRQARDQVEMMNSQLSSYEQDRGKEKKKPQSRYWTPEEHQRFLEALQKYGHKDVKSISMHVSTRNATQVRTHAQKYFLRLERERRKKEENSSNQDGYNSSSSMDDGDSPDGGVEDVGSISISSLTLPGSPAVSMLGESVGTPPGTPGDSPGSPGTPAPSSPVPTRRRRATSFITVAQARLAAQARDSVLVGLPPSWTVEDYDIFMKGLLALADKLDDVTTLCRGIREQYLPHHTPDEVELCYRNVLKSIKQKPIMGSPKRRRTNSRPEPLVSPLGGVAAALAPSFPVPPNSFPFRNSMPNMPPPNAPSSNTNSMLTSLGSSFGSSPPSHSPSSPLMPSQSLSMSSLAPAMRSTAPFPDYGQLSAPLELPLLSDLNINGLAMTPNPQNSIPSNGFSNNSNNSNANHSNSTNNLSAPITPNNLWGSALPFSFDALMSGNVALPQAIPLVSHN